MKKIDLNNKTILITGSNGFIGYHVSNRLLTDYKNIKVIGIDNMDANDLFLKKYRLNILNKFPNYVFIKADIIDKNSLLEIFSNYKVDIVINLAGNSNIRDSIDNPNPYIESNIIGFYNILEACRHNKVEHLIYASSSSVYDDNTKIPFCENDKTDTPNSIYSVTKKTNELFAYCYSKLYDIPTTGLRFFTVYGPLGRTDMMYFKMTNMMIKEEIIKIYNYGNNKRNFTYIDDAVESIIRIMQYKPNKLYSIYNVSNLKSESTLEFINVLQSKLVKYNVLPKNYDFESHKDLVSSYPGEVEIMCADVSNLEKDFGYRPNTSLNVGLGEFAKWYKDYYKQDKR